MKKLITTCVLLTSVSMLSFGQSKVLSHSSSRAPRGTAAAPGSSQGMPGLSAEGEKAAGVRAENYRKKLGLNEEQYKAAYQAELDYERQLETAIGNGGPGPGTAMQMGMGRDQRYKNTLTADQYAKYETLKPKTEVPKQ
jgi:hypothetical protein